MSDAIAYKHLYSDDGDSELVLVKGDDRDAIYRAAREWADDQGMVVLGTADEVEVGHIRAFPCHVDGHRLDFGDCEGDMEVHYQYSPRGGPGSFRGAMVEVRSRAAFLRDQRILAERKAQR